MSEPFKDPFSAPRDPLGETTHYRALETLSLGGLCKEGSPLAVAELRSLNSLFPRGSLLNDLVFIFIDVSITRN